MVVGSTRGGLCKRVLVFWGLRKQVEIHSLFLVSHLKRFNLNFLRLIIVGCCHKAVGVSASPRFLKCSVRAYDIVHYYIIIHLLVRLFAY